MEVTVLQMQNIYIKCVNVYGFMGTKIALLFYFFIFY